ncbi:hypothetical protein [Dokdonella fugitiva]|jgi:hypothetical protein|uniref:Uncharacterized protein n=1 Tax=Dokdonella fugitiva TaxID=328517 RepID=A0A4R2IBS7_9GAMM|nr:hypothetical protein [Dokdonella fugitiva]MBA8884380.1 hypothetical protein [Dokdonella fugitiva]TCO39985.1 hypothetical protein EV148_106140 [Dokdonella fugitiva]
MTSTARRLALPLLVFVSLAHAGHPQSLAARVGDAAFESGDAEISFIAPGGGAFTLNAATRGASAWPPPKTRIDRLAIVCDGFVDGQPLRLDPAAFARSTCSVTFERGSKPMGGDPDASYRLDKRSAENRFEITAANGKVYAGTFAFDLVDDKGATLRIVQGHFEVEDRQL